MKLYEISMLCMSGSTDWVNSPCLPFPSTTDAGDQHKCDYIYVAGKNEVFLLFADKYKYVFCKILLSLNLESGEEVQTVQ